MKRTDIPLQQSPTPPMYRASTAPVSSTDQQHAALQPNDTEPTIKTDVDGGQFSFIQDFMNQDILKNTITKISKSLHLLFSVL